jgi:hypothetical protein
VEVNASSKRIAIAGVTEALLFRIAERVCRATFRPAAISPTVKTLPVSSAIVDDVPKNGTGVGRATHFHGFVI